MLKKSRLFNKSGFSLIELMVVVAIIGILAAIGIPQYSKFQAKTRQSEAKSSLSALYTSETSFLGEWNQYTVNLRNIGFGVSGARLRYVTGFFSGPAAAPFGCTGYSTANGAPNESPGASWVASMGSIATSCATTVNVGAQPGTFALDAAPTGAGITWAANQCGTWGAIVGVAYTNAAAVAAGTACTATAGAQVFTAHAIGEPNATITGFADGWAINQQKVLSNPTPGIN